MSPALEANNSMLERRVLIFPGGTEIAMEILASLRHARGLKLFSAGEDTSNHAPFAFDSYHILPNVKENGWLEAIKALCTKLHIDYIFPAHDDAVVALAKHSHELPGVMAPPLETCEICRSKSRTYNIMSDTICVPRTFSSIDEIDSFPVFVKPDRGQGSKDATTIKSREQLVYAVKNIDEPLICEYLPGEEFTIDCFSSKSGLLFAGARRRIRMRNGISMSTERVELAEAVPLAEAIADKIKMRGAWFFQVRRRTNGDLALLEVAPRIAGAMALHRAAGINFPLLTLFDREEVPVKIMINDQPRILDRSLRNRWMHSLSFKNVYVDLDDTLIENGKVNLELVKFLYSCINSKKKIILLTKHANDLSKTLATHRLTGIFDQVVHIQDGSPKSKFISDRNSIFIDDSFSERLEVATACGIATLDSSMLEFLADQAEKLNTDSSAEKN